MKLAICDDERSCLQEYQARLTAILEKNKILASIDTFHSGKAFMFAMEDGAREVDVLFLDIHMPDVDGMEVARWIREKNLPCEIIFLTVSQTHMLNAFDVGAFHYVVKGQTSPKKLEEICVRVMEQVGKRKREVITVTCAGESRIIPIQDILYFEVCNYIITVYYAEERFEFYSTLGKIENSLMGHGFARTHRSFLVNMRHVHSVARQELKLFNGKSIPVGRKYVEEVRRLMQSQEAAGQSSEDKAVNV